MSQNPHFQVYDDPKPLAPEWILGEAEITSLLVAGIVNPFGPTMEALLCWGDPLCEGPDSFSVLHLILNPFSQELRIVGDGYFGEVGYYVESECLEPYYCRFKTCPTLLLDVPAFIPEAEYRFPYLREFLKSRPRARDVLNAITRHPFDPWSRVGNEVQSAAQRLHSPAPPLPPLSDSEADKLLTTLLDKRHFDPEVRAFIYAWNGAIKFQERNGNSALAGSAMPLNQFLEYYARLRIAAGLPPTL